jgi:hypothetical protein
MEYHTRTTITVNAELDILKEIKELCEKERKSLSEKINELFIEELEKKVVGCKNPLNVSYNQQEEKPFQSDLIAWFDHVDTVNEHQELNKLKGQALALCKRVDKRSMELYRNGIKS